MVTEQLKDEIAAGQGEPIAKLARRCGSFRANKPRTLGCVVRWIQTGTMTSTGERVYLEAIKTPGGWLSTMPALVRFFEALTPTIGEVPAARSSSTRGRKPQARAQKAGEKLAAMGI